MDDFGDMTYEETVLRLKRLMYVTHGDNSDPNLQVAMTATMATVTCG